MTPSPEKIVVVGGNGGLGQALVRELLQSFPESRVRATYRRGEIPYAAERLHWQKLDLLDTDAVADWAEGFERVDWLINCAGMLHRADSGPEKSIRAFDSDFFVDSIRINTLPTLLLASQFATALKRSPAPLLATISARVGSIEDNRRGGWYSYRISKAALNMALKTLSIEWQHSHPRGCIAALHPGTNDTPLSQPFQQRVPAGDLMQPADTAAALVELLSRLEPADSGKFLAWNGEELPW